MYFEGIQVINSVNSDLNRIRYPGKGNNDKSGDEWGVDYTGNKIIEHVTKETTENVDEILILKIYESLYRPSSLNLQFEI